MSIFTGPQGKGAMRRHRERECAEAMARQDASTYRLCGHMHVPNAICRVADLDPDGGADA